jgi:iron complex transport system ATP-binding protein
MTALEADGIRARHGARVVLDGVGLTLAAGDRVAVVGANGSGKSTLLRALLGLEPAAHGAVRLGGRPLGAMSRGEIARAATLVLQDTHVEVPITVRELVALGRYPHRGASTAARDRDAIARALAHAELEALAERDVRTLSGGELQRAHLARALAQETPVVLLDEPTASLDLHHQLHTLATLGALAAEGRAVLVVLHDLALAARWAERIVVLGAGRVLAGGAPEDVLTPATIREAFGVEARVERVAGSLVVIPDDPE